jgi:hypothetical protein
MEDAIVEMVHLAAKGDATSEKGAYGDLYAIGVETISEIKDKEERRGGSRG